MHAGGRGWQSADENDDAQRRQTPPWPLRQGADHHAVARQARRLKKHLEVSSSRRTQREADYPHGIDRNSGCSGRAGRRSVGIDRGWPGSGAAGSRAGRDGLGRVTERSQCAVDLALFALARVVYRAPCVCRAHRCDRLRAARRMGADAQRDMASWQRERPGCWEVIQRPPSGHSLCISVRP